MSLQFRKNRDIFHFIYSEIEKSKKSIKAALAWFTDPELLKLLLNKKTQDNVDISIILFNDEINRKLNDLHLLGDTVQFSNILKIDYIMHHKFCIIDDTKVITGSYNWTVKARRYNKENILCIEDEAIVKDFKDEFESLSKNSKPQTRVSHLQITNQINNIEDLAILNLEQEYNREIERRIEVSKKLNIGLDIALAYSLITKHTAVIAATLLATAENGQYIQSALKKLEEAGRLDLCFEESIIRREYSILFDEKTKHSARQKLVQLDYFKNPKYAERWVDYD
ncbi:phospholipase D-like domain-containing protein [Parasediminibacterium sp. JCM 36343]|uniref:phospholipase D-like domain-containing protein n=1 Tax=Parasediminibacterium sp. JCM 36343 TaxID=3374279 RepID=UPI0039798144